MREVASIQRKIERNEAEVQAAEVWKPLVPFRPRR